MVQVTREFVHHCLPVRKRDGHKGTFGKVHILAGSEVQTGKIGQFIPRGVNSL